MKVGTSSDVGLTRASVASIRAEPTGSCSVHAIAAPSMRLVRRLSAAFSSVLLLQLSLLSSGTLCAVQHTSGHAAMRAGAWLMPGMSQAARSATVSAATQQPTTPAENPADGCGGHRAGDSCGGPWATGSCTSMGACAWSQSAAVPALTAVNSETRVNHSEPRTLRTGPVVAPELPPPRA